MPDTGRGKILADKQDPSAEAMMGAFKTPSLRSVTDTGPYFHDGSAKTLDEAVSLLLKGGVDNAHKDEKLKAHTITAPEKKSADRVAESAFADAGEVRTAEAAVGSDERSAGQGGGGRTCSDKILKCSAWIRLTGRVGPSSWSVVVSNAALQCASPIHDCPISRFEIPYFFSIGSRYFNTFCRHDPYPASFG